MQERKKLISSDPCKVRRQRKNKKIRYIFIPCFYKIENDDDEICDDFYHEY